jgi:hypothetical protein
MGVRGSGGWSLGRAAATAGAALALPSRPDDKTVLAYHQAAVQGIVDVYGVAGPLNFAAEG